jgi:hypothetical protein
MIFLKDEDIDLAFSKARKRVINHIEEIVEAKKFELDCSSFHRNNKDESYRFAELKFQDERKKYFNDKR